MATARQILTNTFGVKAITATDPGIVRLAEIRTGTYDSLGPVTVTPQAEVAQLLGLAPDPLAEAARAGTLDKSSSFLDTTLPKLLTGLVGVVGGAGAYSELASNATKPKQEGSTWASGTTSPVGFQDFLIRLARQRAQTMAANSFQVLGRTFSGVATPPILARLSTLKSLRSGLQAQAMAILPSWPPRLRF